MSETTEIVKADSQRLLEARSPKDLVLKAKEVAEPLKNVIEQQALFTVMGRTKGGAEKRHVNVEGWLLLGSLITPSVHPHTVWTRKLTDPDGWEARVEARTIDGRVISAAESACCRDEEKWAGKDDYQLKSMAQTRATSKALSQALRFIMVLAGFEATPAEEITSDSYVGDLDKAAEWVQKLITATEKTPTQVLAVARKIAKKHQSNARPTHLDHLTEMPDSLRIELLDELQPDDYQGTDYEGTPQTVEQRAADMGILSDTVDAEVVDEGSDEPVAKPEGPVPGCPDHPDEAKPEECEKCKGIVDGWGGEAK